MPMWKELHWRKRQTMGLETQGTQVKLGRKSLGKIQTSTAFIWRESPCTLGRSEGFKILKKIHCTWSIRKRPTWHVYKILLADPTSKFLPSGTLFSGMNCLSNMFWSTEDSQLLHSWCFVLQCMCYSSAWCGCVYGFNSLNIWCVSGAILWVSWLFFNFSAAFSCYNAWWHSVLRSLPTLESDSVVPSEWE